jgi:hypothetical protein
MPELVGTKAGIKGITSDDIDKNLLSQLHKGTQKRMGTILMQNSAQFPDKATTLRTNYVQIVPVTDCE